MAAKRRKLPSDVPYHYEYLWALIRAEKGKTSMMYLVAPTRKQLWDSVVELGFYGTGHTRETLQQAGFVARSIRVEEVQI